jgi:hypothetical protein
VKEEQDSIKLIRSAIDRDITFIDTASAERFNSIWHHGSQWFAFLSAVLPLPCFSSNCEEP